VLSGKSFSSFCGHSRLFFLSRPFPDFDSNFESFLSWRCLRRGCRLACSRTLRNNINNTAQQRTDRLHDKADNNLSTLVPSEVILISRWPETPVQLDKRPNRSFLEGLHFTPREPKPHRPDPTDLTTWRPNNSRGH
jgi:hypothetical protein